MLLVKGVIGLCEVMKWSMPVPAHPLKHSQLQESTTLAQVTWEDSGIMQPINQGENILINSSVWRAKYPRVWNSLTPGVLSNPIPLQQCRDHTAPLCFATFSWVRDPEQTQNWACREQPCAGSETSRCWRGGKALRVKHTMWFQHPDTGRAAGIPSVYVSRHLHQAGGN